MFFVAAFLFLIVMVQGQIMQDADEERMAVNEIIEKSLKDYPARGLNDEMDT
jgi:hypothetical protein